MERSGAGGNTSRHAEGRRCEFYSSLHIRTTNPCEEIRDHAQAMFCLHYAYLTRRSMDRGKFRLPSSSLPPSLCTLLGSSFRSSPVSPPRLLTTIPLHLPMRSTSSACPMVRGNYGMEDSTSHFSLCSLDAFLDTSSIYAGPTHPARVLPTTQAPCYARPRINKCCKAASQVHLRRLKQKTRRF